MKIYIPNQSKQTIGGGFTFLRNFSKGIFSKAELVYDVKDCDIFFIAGSSVVLPKEVEEAKALGKKIVLRVDNIPRNSRNRNTGTSRLKKYAEMAEVVVYQSEWAKEYVGEWLGIDGPVIYNGVDKKVFNTENRNPSRDRNRYLFLHYNRDENKRFPEVWYDFQNQFKEDNNAELWLVGRFADNLIEYNFDFYRGEKVKYLGVIDRSDKMAEIMKQCDFIYYPSFIDACPNTLMEAMACGLAPLLINDIGGSNEIVELYNSESINDITEMADEYLGIFNLVMQNL